MSMIINAVKDGGEWMVPIIVFLVCGLAIAFERLYTVWGFVSAGKSGLVDSAVQGLINGSLAEAQQQCEGNKGLPVVLTAGMETFDNSAEIDEIKNAMDSKALETYGLLTKRALFLPVIANLATLSGLLGTIVGLIQAFDAVANAPADKKQTLLASGISVAMYTTAGGLVCAIPVLLLNSFVQHFTNKVMDDIDQATTRFLVEASKRR